MKKLNKKGFTLIELMIVLAIIAILAIVLVPKAGQMKSQAKAVGITTNVNSVRGYFESQIPSGSPETDRANIVTDMKAKYVNTTSIINPFNNGADIGTSVGINTYALSTTGNSVLVFGWNGSINNTSYQTSFPWLGANMNGCVVAVVCNDGYLLYGVDNTGKQTNYTIVK